MSAQSALRKLAWLRMRAVGRRVLQSFGSFQGIAFLATAFGVLCLWLSLLVIIPNAPPGMFKTTPADLAEAAGPCMLAAMAMAVLMGDDRTSRFTPAEVDFLFPAPFSRRRLMAMKLVENAVGAAAAGLFIFTGIVHFVKLPLAAFLACFQALLFVQLGQMAFVLALRGLSEKILFLDRRWVMGGVLVLIGLLVAGTAAVFRLQDPWEAWVGFRKSGLGIAVFAPFAPFGALASADRWWPDGLLALAGAVGMNLLACAVIFRLDEAYIEEALSSSQRFHALLQRAQRGGVLSIWGSPLRWRFPKFPRLGGAGPILWRQATQAARSLPTLIAIAGVVCFVVIGPQIFTSRMKNLLPEAATVGIAAAAVQLTLVFTFMMRFDFRGDLDQMDLLKTLPTHPLAVAAGQLLIPTFLATAVQGGLIIGLAFTVAETRNVLFACAALTLPLNLFLFGLENLMFLLFPSRSVAFNPGDLQGFGHQVVLFAVKLFFLGIATSAALVPGIVVGTASGSLLAGASLAWTILIIEALLLWPLVAWAFARFDPSLEKPPAE